MFDGCDISKLAADKYRFLLADYLLYIKLGWKHFGNKDLSSDIRLTKIRLLEKALRKPTPVNGLIFRLQNAFVKENISLSILLEPLSAWRFLAEDKFPTSGSQLSEILNRLLSPAARLVLALDDENPCTYFPLTSLLVLLFMLELFKTSDIFQKKTKMNKKQKESQLSGLYKNSKVLLSLIKNKRLKFRLALLLNTACLHTDFFKNNKQHNSTFLDYFRIILYSVLQFLFIKRKSVENKGI